MYVLSSSLGCYDMAPAFDNLDEKAVWLMDPFTASSVIRYHGDRTALRKRNSQVQDGTWCVDIAMASMATLPRQVVLHVGEAMHFTGDLVTSEG